MKWLVVGQKGEKRLYKGVERGPPPGHQDNQRSKQPPDNRLQPSTHPPRLSSKRGHSGNDSEEETAGRSNQSKKKQQRTQQDTEDSESEMEEEVSQGSRGRTRAASEVPEGPQA